MIPTLSDLSSEDIRRAVNCAIGRLFKMAARPAQPGDEDAFFRIRAVVLDGSEALVARGEMRPPSTYQPSPQIELANMRRRGFCVD